MTRAAFAQLLAGKVDRKARMYHTLQDAIVALGLSDLKTEIIQFWNECKNESSKTREDWQICGCDEERLLIAPYLICAFRLFGCAKPHPPVAAVAKGFVLRVTAAA